MRDYRAFMSSQTSLRVGYSSHPFEALPGSCASRDGPSHGEKVTTGTSKFMESEKLESTIYR